MSDVIRCKFRCNTVTEMKVPEGEHAGETYQETVQLAPVTDTNNTDPENHSFWKYTPAGNLQLYITNQKTFGFWKQGKDYYVDIFPAETE